MSSLEESADYLASIREDRLNSYHHTPEGVGAHFSDEGQIQSDYHKRFAFELVQKADDAIQGTDGTRTVRFELVDDVLLVANTGRPISEDDVRALCVMSHTTKGPDGERRASIGHKGRGFSSVSEVTDRSQVFSTGDAPDEGISFEFDREKS